MPGSVKVSTAKACAPSASMNSGLISRSSAIARREAVDTDPFHPEAHGIRHGAAHGLIVVVQIRHGVGTAEDSFALLFPNRMDRHEPDNLDAHALEPIQLRSRRLPRRNEKEPPLCQAKPRPLCMVM